MEKEITKPFCIFGMRIRYENIKNLGSCLIAFCLSADGYAFGVGPMFFMENEIWKEVEGHSGYFISNFGNVKSAKKGVLKNYVGTIGYPVISLKVNGKFKPVLIHRLVAKAFIPNPENKREVNHISGIKTDNRVENLEWCTRKENAQHSYRIGLQKPKFGRISTQCTPILQFDRSGLFMAEWPSLSSIKKHFGSSIRGVEAVLKNERKTAFNYVWKRK